MDQSKSKKGAGVTIALFLMETLAFVSFSLGNSYYLYALIGTLVLLGVIGFSDIKFSKKGYTTVLSFAIPLVIFGVLNFTSGFSRYFDSITNIFVPVGLAAFAALGYVSNELNGFTLKKAFLFIYGALAILTFINLFYNMIQFVPFYTITFANRYLYYDGLPSPLPIGQIAYFLLGFNFMEVTVEFFALFPSLLSTAVIALFFIDRKKDKKLFVIYAVFAAIGILSLVIMPTKLTLISTFLIAIAIILVLLFAKNKINIKIFKNVAIVGAALFLVLFVFTYLNANMNFSFVANNPLLNKIFNANALAVKYNAILKDMFSSGKFLGYNFEEFFDLGVDIGVSNSWIFDNFIFSGVLGAIAFIAALIFGGRSIYLYCKNSKESTVYKALLVAFVVTFVIYSGTVYDSQPYVYYMNFIPYYMCGPFLVVIFLIGHTTNIKKEEIVVAEEVPTSEVIKHNDYTEIQIGGEN